MGGNYRELEAMQRLGKARTLVKAAIGEAHVPPAFALQFSDKRALCRGEAQ